MRPPSEAAIPRTKARDLRRLGFSINEYHARTGWWATINTFTEWWNDCTGGSTAFAAHDALWINNHGDSPGALPAGWNTYFVWQWADTGVFPGDQDVMNPKALKRLLHPRH